MWWVGLAWAEPPPPSDGAEEILVVGERLAAARADVAEALRDRAYFRLVTVGHRAYYLTPQVWKPWVMVHDEGFARVHGVHFYPIPASRSDTPRLPDGTRMATGTFVIHSHRAVRSQREKLAEALEPRLADVREAEWAIARRERSRQLALTLAAVWFDGVDPDGAPLPGAMDRRRAIVALWRNTEPDAAGQQVRDQVATFVDTEVQSSDHPFRAVEVLGANLGRRWAAPLEPSLRR